MIRLHSNVRRSLKCRIEKKLVISASLLVIGPVLPRFNIGMDAWMDYDLFGPARSVTQANRKRSMSEAGPSDRSPTPQMKLALAIEPCPTMNGRFAKATREEIDKYAEHYVPMIPHSGRPGHSETDKRKTTKFLKTY